MKKFLIKMKVNKYEKNLSLSNKLRKRLFEASIFLLIFAFIAVVYYYIEPMFIIFSANKPGEEILFTSHSPDSSISLEVYLDNGSATVDYSIKVYIKTEKDKRIIYNEYHGYDAEVEWLNNDVVQINDIELDLSKNQTYDWRRGVR